MNKCHCKVYIPAAYREPEAVWMKGLVGVDYVLGAERGVGRVQVGAEPRLILTSSLPSGRSGLGPTTSETTGTELA